MQSNTNPQDSNMIGSHELKEITELLIKHHGLHDGLYDLVLEFGVAIGAVGPAPDQILPGVMVGVRRVGIAKATTSGPNTIDAAKINPTISSKKIAAEKKTSSK